MPRETISPFPGVDASGNVHRFRRWSRIVGLTLLEGALLLIGIGGIYGGVIFLIDPSGHLMGMSLSYIAPLALNSYLLPGLWLLIVMGICPFIILYGLWRRPRWHWLDPIERRSHAHWAWTAALALSIVLLMQLGVELLIGMFAPPTVVTGLLGMIVLVCTLLPGVRADYRLP